MAISPTIGTKRSYSEFNSSNIDPFQEDILKDLVFEAFQHHRLGHDLLKARSFSRAKILNPNHPFITHFHLLQLNPANNTIFIP